MAGAFGRDVREGAAATLLQQLDDWVKVIDSVEQRYEAKLQDCDKNVYQNTKKVKEFNDTLEALKKEVEEKLMETSDGNAGGFAGLSLGGLMKGDKNMFKALKKGFMK